VQYNSPAIRDDSQEEGNQKVNNNDRENERAQRERENSQATPLYVPPPS